MLIVRYEFEYEDDSGDEAGDVGIENQYYNAKQMREDKPTEAIADFLGLAQTETEKGDWGFKGLKQAIKLEYQLRRYDQAVEHYTELLTYVKSAVTRNYSEKSINSMLDFIEKGAEDDTAYHCMEQFYSHTLRVFQTTNNERLWLKTNIKLARLWLERKQYGPLVKLVKELHRACQREDGSDDHSKGTYALEIFALEIQMYSDTKNNKRLKGLYEEALKVRSAVPHPKIMGIIRECGGKMHMREESWEEARSDFFESFRNYDEAGSLQRIQVLKYMVLTTMLTKSDINPFESQETKPYKNNAEISVMTDLVEAYQQNDVHKYEAILQKNKQLLNDPFIAENIDEVTRTLRMSGVVKLIAPYTRFRLDFVADRMHITPAEAQQIVGQLILDGKLDGKIDQVQGIAELNKPQDALRTEAISQWSSAMDKVWRDSLENGEGFRQDEGRMFGGTAIAPFFGSSGTRAARSMGRVREAEAKRVAV